MAIRDAHLKGHGEGCLWLLLLKPDRKPGGPFITGLLLHISYMTTQNPLQFTFLAQFSPKTPIVHEIINYSADLHDTASTDRIRDLKFDIPDSALHSINTMISV